MNSNHWLSYFRQNRLNRPEPEWQLPRPGHSPATNALARSLSHFQLGESGEGRFLLAEAGRSYAHDPDYCEALDLFIQEEQEHARLLEKVVLRLGGRLIAQHWTHWLFRLLRRALGVHFEIQVLVIAELVGTGYYRLLRCRSTDPVILQVCDLVLQDEARHVEFHSERFAANHAEWLPLERAVWAAQFQLLFLGATAVAWLDHGSALGFLGSSRREFLHEVRSECIRFLAMIEPQRFGASDLKVPAR
ncbi:MAG: hypothetical protein QOE70_51 [Chthoniobacter sp.]|jgi:hypothetical protein|nr:hypothetical protein [Chthoniobacter sp.]